MKKKTYAGEFFKTIQKDIGDSTDFQLYHQTHPDGEKDFFRYSHAEHDGFTAFLDILTHKNKAQPENFPKLGPVFKPPGYYILWKFFLKSLNVYFKSSSYKNFNTSVKVSPTELPKSYASETLSLKESQQIDQFCKEHRIPPMAFLLYYLDQEVETLTTGTGKRIWMVPVSLRSQLTPQETDEDLLMTGFMDLTLPTPTPKLLGSQIKNEFKNCAHWVGFYAFGLARFVPGLLFRLLVRLQSKVQFRTGNFSYMGRWGDEKNPTTDVFGGYPPVTRNQPVAGIAVHWCGQLTLNFIAHPFLSNEVSYSSQIVRGWRHRLLEASKGSHG